MTPYSLVVQYSPFRHRVNYMVGSGKVTAAINGSNDRSKLRLQSTIAEVKF